MKKYVVANLKMNFPECSFKEYLEKLSCIETNNELIVSLPFTHLYMAQSFPRLSISAQNINDKISGAYTGEISVEHLKSLNIKNVIIGHSERRHIYCETNSQIADKVKIALANGLKVIFCYGETKEERDKNLTEKIIKEQITSALNILDEASRNNILYCYEPVWSIGTGDVPTNADINKVVKIVLSILKNYNTQNPQILYGGSVNENNIGEIGKCDINGVLVGGASKSIDKMIKIIKGL